MLSVLANLCIGSEAHAQLASSRRECDSPKKQLKLQFVRWVIDGAAGVQQLRAMGPNLEIADLFWERSQIVVIENELCQSLMMVGG